MDDTKIRIDWDQPYDGASQISSYSILIADSEGNFLPESTSCSGSDPTLTQCDIEMSILRASPFNLQEGSIVIAKVRGANENGEGQYSEPNSSGARIQVVPYQMDKPVRGIDTTEAQIQINWTELALN